MGEIKIGYKMVRKNNQGQFLSPYERQEEGGIIYKLNEWVYPKENHGPLFIYTFNEKKAKKFIWGTHHIFMFKCEYESYKFTDIKMEEYFKSIRPLQIYKTDFAAKVKLIEEILDGRVKFKYLFRCPTPEFRERCENRCDYSCYENEINEEYKNR